MNADDVVSLIIRWRLVREDISTHELADGQIFGAQSHDRKPQSVFVSHIASKPPRLAP